MRAVGGAEERELKAQEQGQQAVLRLVLASEAYAAQVMPVPTARKRPGVLSRRHVR